LFFIYLACALSCLAQQKNDVLVGAIRWDAWYRPIGTEKHDGPVAAVEKSLSPGKYHFRAPFFSKELSDSTIQVIGYDQTIMGKEIEFAHHAGLDYWAFLLYDENNQMSEGLKIFLAHKDRMKVNFCAIVEPKRFIRNSSVEKKRILNLLNEPNYQKVMSERPLIYFFRPDEKMISECGGEEAMKILFNGVRDAVVKAGHGNPYFVIMKADIKGAKKMMDLMSADAVSEYAFQDDHDKTKITYNDLCSEVKDWWAKQKNAGLKSIPLIMSGWNRWPRIDHPVPWEKNWQIRPGLEITKNYELPTPTELAEHISDGIKWVSENRELCPAQSVLVYAWNEHDEGGWLCPTFVKDGKIDNSRLESIKKVLDHR